MNGKARLRLFFGVWPEPELASRLAEWAREVAQATGGRVTRAETIHLTLAFLGDIPAARLPSAVAAARRVPVRACAMPLDAARYWAHNHIVWVGPRESPAPLSQVAACLRRELEAEGFRLEAHPFQAHVTLIRKAHTPQRLPELPRLEWPIDGFALVRTLLEREGARYEVIEQFTA